MPNPRNQIAQQGQLSMDSFMNALKGIKDEQLRTTMGSKVTPGGFAPVGVVAPRIDNPNKMQNIMETKWVTDSAEQVRREVAHARQTKQLTSLAPIAIVAYFLFK